MNHNFSSLLLAFTLRQRFLVALYACDRRIDNSEWTVTGQQEVGDGSIVAVLQDDIGATVFKLGAGDDLKKTRAVNVLGPIKRIYF